MAGKRGVWLVIVLVIVAVLISAAGLVVTALVIGREPEVAGNSALTIRVSGNLEEIEPGGLVGLVYRSAAHGPLARRHAAQGQGRSPHHERRPPSDEHRRALGQGPGSARRDHRLQDVRQADRRLPRIRRRAGVLPRDRVRQGVPDAARVARSHGHGQLRAVPPRHARQDWRLSGRAAHRRVQDGVEHVHRAHLHARAPGDGGIAQHRSLRTADSRHCARVGGSRSRKSGRWWNTVPICPRTRCAPVWSTISPTRTSSTTRCSSGGRPDRTSGSWKKTSTATLA